MNENRVNPEVINEIYFLIEEIQECECNERFYWYKQWYKKGFVDAKNIEIETKEFEDGIVNKFLNNKKQIKEADTEASAKI